MPSVLRLILVVVAMCCFANGFVSAFLLAFHEPLLEMHPGLEPQVCFGAGAHFFVAAIWFFVGGLAIDRASR